jgi:hypothetical protein
MYERGATGERAVAAILDQLRTEGWGVIHDVRWPGRQRANLDHIAVGPPGVFVIDAKNWSGRIDVGDQTFRWNGRRQDRVVAAAGDAALAVAALLNPEAGALTRSALCFVRDEPLAGWCYDVMVCSTANLREMLLSRPAVLTSDQVKVASVELQLGFGAAAARQPVPPAVARQPTVAQFVRQVAAPSARPMPPVRRRSSSASRKSGCVGPLLRLAIGGIAFLVGISLLPQLAQFVGDQVTQSVTSGTKTYSSCSKLRQDYPRGVGTRAAVRRTDAKGKAPAVESEVYEANARLDVDDDGLACERS